MGAMALGCCIRVFVRENSRYPVVLRAVCGVLRSDLVEENVDRKNREHQKERDKQQALWLSAANTDLVHLQREKLTHQEAC